MNKLQLSSLIAAVGLTGAMHANAQTEQDHPNSASPELTPGTANPMPATHPAEGTAADRTAPGDTPVRGTAASRAPEQPTAQDSGRQGERQGSGSITPGTANPIPATSRAEGTAADTTPPGGTPVRGAAASQAPEQPTAQGRASPGQSEEHLPSSSAAPSSANPLPATRTAEGTAADSSQPGETSVRGTASSRAPDAATSRVATAERVSQGARRGSTMIGAAVKDSQGQPAGTVQDIIIDPKSGRVTHAVVAQRAPTESLVLIPWRTVESMHRDGAMIVDRDRLASAPKFSPTQWPDFKRADWSHQADRYWERNMTGTAETTQRE